MGAGIKNLKSIWRALRVIHGAKQHVPSVEDTPPEAEACRYFSSETNRVPDSMEISSLK